MTLHPSPRTKPHWVSLVPDSHDSITRGASVIIAIVALACGPIGATTAQERPKDEDLRSIIEQLSSRHTQGAKVSFVDGGSATIPCGMQPTDMIISRGNVSKSFPVLVHKRHGKVNRLFAKLDRLTVDADGAGRAYHPDDPLGENTCSATANADQICALDNISNAGMRLFHGSTRLMKSSTPTDNQAFLPNWRDMWPLIRDEKLMPLRLSTVVGPDGPRDYNLFHWPERNLTFAFNTKIVPATKTGYPCLNGRQSKYAGYFLSATTLKNERHGNGEACVSDMFIDSETIPFFVVPKEKFEGVELGDIAVGIMAMPNDLRIVYGIAGDTGPYDHFGEGSIAFNKTLLGVERPIENAKDVDRLDIDISKPDRFHGSDASLAVLLLGGTKRLLNGDFSASNIRRIGEVQFKQWDVASGSGGRLRACLTPTP
jgi:Fungal chitosanase of glycosyl hydrolase group 75